MGVRSVGLRQLGAVGAESSRLVRLGKSIEQRSSARPRGDLAGECERNADFMLARCPKQCKAASGKPQGFTPLSHEAAEAAMFADYHRRGGDKTVEDIMQQLKGVAKPTNIA